MSSQKSNKFPINNSVVSIRQRMIDWNNRFPLDAWWRKKYNEDFLGAKHSNTDLIKICFDWLEFVEIEFERLNKELKVLLDKNGLTEQDLLQSEPMSQTEIEDFYQNIDLDNYNE